MLRVSQILTAILILVATSFVFTGCSDSRHLVTWNIYYGELETNNGSYHVDINESDYGDGFRRTVNLQPVDKPTYVDISGHDYNLNDGQWDRIFYCGNHSLISEDSSSAYGCNSVFWTKDGWEFEPCPADEGNIKPFSQEAIEFAIYELDIAMAQIYNRVYLVAQWKWDEEKEELIKVY